MCEYKNHTRSNQRLIKSSDQPASSTKPSSKMTATASIYLCFLASDIKIYIASVIRRNRYPLWLVAFDSPVLHEFSHLLFKVFQVGGHDHILYQRFLLCEEIIPFVCPQSPILQLQWTILGTGSMSILFMLCINLYS